MKISVIIPVYNVASFLPKCLDSVYAQDLDGVEVVLVNDGSTDDSLSICEYYKQRYPLTIVVNKENGGLSDARNVGTAVAHGDYIFYLDSDDWLAPNALTSLYDMAIKYDSDVVQGGFYYAYEDKLLRDMTESCLEYVMTRQQAMGELVRQEAIKNFAWGKLYRKSIVSRFAFPVGKYFEDSYWQHLVINEVNKYCILSTPLYYYRQRQSGISGGFSMKQMDLLNGYEVRMDFIRTCYPELEKDMAQRWWNTAYQFYWYAKGCGMQDVIQVYSNYLRHVSAATGSLLKGIVSYEVYNRVPILMPVEHLVNRVFHRLWG